jgi:leucyl aminopeptidase
MKELFLYKDIVIDSNKTPETYLKYIKSRIPKNYICKVIDINKSKLFPLSKAVGKGSQYNSYFTHIYPKNIDIKKKSIFLVGKGVCFDAGGLNLKYDDYSCMKIDMTGSAIVVSVLNLLVKNKYDLKYNIHILSSIVENMISSKATRPGTVIRTLNNKTVEIINTDAEGRLCIVDNINYINKYLLNNNSIIIDIATLTGNASLITTDLSSIITSNKIGYTYVNKLIEIGNAIYEYVDYLTIYKEYYKILNSTVADIKSINTNIKADCILAATFISYFIKDNIPWIHIDLGGVSFKNSLPQSYGINLLYEFIKNI